MKKLISFMLVLATVLSCFTITTVTAFADDSADLAPDTVLDEDKTFTHDDILVDSYNRNFDSGYEFLMYQLSPHGKNQLPFMQLMASAGGYKLYCNPYTGEVAYLNVATKQVLTSNPYDFSTITGGATTTTPDISDNTVFTKLLSQIEVSFLDNTGTPQSFHSFVEAAARDQIVVKRMKNGFRVEYTMGRLNTTYLIPGVVTAEDYRKHVLDPFEAVLDEILFEFGSYSEAYTDAMSDYNRFSSWYFAATYDSVDASLREDLAKKYPIFKPVSQGGEGATLYLQNAGIQDKERVDLENILKSYCPDFNFETLDEMHSKTGYRPDVNETPVFRVAIEYVLEDDGLSVRIPASSIRFDESKYTLRYVKPLPFFGAGNLMNDGYVFYPDGSGALVEFEDFYSQATSDGKVPFTLTGTVYGEDFAYYNIDTNAKHSEAIRMPVFGIVEKDKASDEDDANAEPAKAHGFFAVLEDGDALADVATTFGGGEYNYASAYVMVYPRPSDEYNLSEVISVADNKTMTIVSDKKYTGFYKMKYMMLFDETNLEKDAKESGDRYEASYSGMADAYRDYLVANGTLSALKDADVEKDKLPLYVETLGSIETVKKILSIPVNVDVPLASFEDIQTMYTQLEKKGITNVNFKLTGYTNGGLSGDYPKKVKWMRSVGGKSGFEELQTFASEKGIGLYPEFDFSYARYKSGINLKKYASRAVDDRYCSKQLYNPVYQDFESFFDVCISPASVFEMVEKFTDSYSKYNPTGISVSTLGSDLNSDFNKDEPLNRQDAEKYIADSLALLDEKYQSVMADGGNIFSVRYLDHVLNVPLDSSKYKYESKSVPFFGMVLHGYINYAGGVINEAGDSSYQILKSIENGSLLYYMLIYQNSNLLKEDEELSKFYSVRFDIWFSTIVEQYNKLNGAIGDLQLYNIVDHEFIIAERVLTETENERNEKSFNNELAADLAAQYKTIVNAKRRALRIQQTAQNLITGGSIDLTAADASEKLLARVLYVLGYAEDKFSDADKKIVTDALDAYKANTPFENLYDKAITVSVNRTALETAIIALTKKPLTDGQEAVLEDFITNSENCVVTAEEDADIKAFKDLDETLLPEYNITSSFAQDGDKYEKTAYTDASDRIVLVTYAKGNDIVRFVLNYNTYSINVRLEGVNGGEAFEVPAYGFARINGTTLAD